MKGKRLGRPKVALISREDVLEVALKIIDTEGLKALSIRKMGSVIGVHGASLYHHFENKEDIINGAAELALSRTPFQPPRVLHQSWEILLLAGVLQLRDFLLSHPHLLPIFVQRRTVGLANQFVEVGVKHLVEANMPWALVAPLTEALEAMTVGWSMRQISRKAGNKAKAPDLSLPFLSQAAEKTLLAREEVFEPAVVGIIEHFKALHAAGTADK